MNYLIFVFYFALLMGSITIIHSLIRGFKYSSLIRIPLFFVPFFIPMLQYGLPNLGIGENTKYIILCAVVASTVSIVILIFHVTEIKPYFLREIYELVPPISIKTFLITEYALIGSAIAEEFFYRYYLPKENLLAYIILSTILFVSAHFIQKSTRREFSVKSYISLFILAIVWCCLTLISKSIIPAIVGHLVYNSPKILANIYHLFYSLKFKAQHDEGNYYNSK